MDKTKNKSKKIQSKTGRIILYIILSAMIICGLCIYFSSQLPDKYYVFEEDSNNLKNVLNSEDFYPVTSTVTVTDKGYEIDFKLLGII